MLIKKSEEKKLASEIIVFKKNHHIGGRNKIKNLREMLFKRKVLFKKTINCWSNFIVINENKCIL